MIIGIGCDIVKIARISGIMHNQSLFQRFLKRIYHNNELSEIPSDKIMLARYLAKRFAAKEACAKALGYGIGKLFGWKDIWVERSENNKPILKIKDHGHLKAHLSLADESEYAIAYVTLEV